MSVQAPPMQVPQPKRRFGRSGEGTLRERVEGILFALPALVVLGLFVIYPAYYTIRLAFYGSDFLFAFTNYVGLDNFKDLLTDNPDFLDLSKFPPSGALINNLRWVIIYISLSLIFGLGLAVLTIRVRYEAVVKAVIFVPMAISATAVGVIWLLVYSPDPDIGTFNAVIHLFGANPIPLLGKPNTVNYAIIVAYVWASTGFAMVVLSAALKGIPTEIIEAARVDGAGEWNIFRLIMLLLMIPVMILNIKRFRSERVMT